MTIRNTRSIRTFAALSLALLSVTATAAVAADGPYYRAVLTPKTAPDHVISSGVAWEAKGNELDAGETGDQPWMVCAELAHEVGTISSFTAEGKELNQDKLAYCNKNAHKTKG